MTAPGLLTISVVLGCAMLGGRLARLARQPAVIGEMLLVIALGPALLGWLAPGVEAYLFPQAVRPVLGVLAQLGVAVFMFLVGLEAQLERGRGRGTAGVTALSLTLPLVLGMLAALALQDQRGAAPLWAFVLFVGGSLAVTAVPVLALILRDQGLAETPLASTALAAAAASDVLAWVLLAVVAVGTGGPQTPVAAQAAAVAALFAGMALARLLLRRFERHGLLDRLHPTTLIGGALVAVTASAVASDAAGLHTVVGPLLLGGVMPRSARLGEVLERTLGHVARAALLPFFFVTAGLALDLSSLASPWVTALLLAAAVLGKLGGALGGARLVGLGWPEAWRLGVLLNTRGLTELVFLAAGLQLSVIKAPLYTSLVVVALITTAATGPLLGLGQDGLKLPRFRRIPLS